MVDRDSSAHFVLLGINYTIKINLWSIDASHFDESYASPGHKAKISWILPRGVEDKAKKTLFLQRHLLDVPLWTNVRTGHQSTGPSLGHQGLGPSRALNAP